ncbi:MAG: primosomal protein N' [Paludibacteraceae bacterium]|nr:primosomal protein N' [Paludibacteraceae bacterium]
MSQYADVILPLPLYSVFTYSVPQEAMGSLCVGMRVVVPVRNKFYTAIVERLHDEEPDFEVKPIASVVDDRPTVLQSQLQFWHWIADYYQCPIGDVYKAAVPSELKLESESLISPVPDADLSSLTPNELRVYEAFGSKTSIDIKSLSKATGITNALSIVRSLISKGAVEMTERIVDGYKPKKETYVTLSPAMKTEDDVTKAFESLKAAKKQSELFSSFLTLTKAFSDDALTEISRKELLTEASSSAAILKALVDKGYLVTYSKVMSRLYVSDEETKSHYDFNNDQSQAYDDINELFKTKDTVLLHGVTASGKTEVYIHLIEDIVNSGRQVLVLLPEIVLTEQITTRLRRVFGDRLGVYHSKFPDSERVEIWNKQLSASPYQVILGARSSIFLPFQNLGLVIVDEEHEGSYKQMDPSPRYNARNAAIVLAIMHKCKTLLGSATPSLESYNNAKIGRFGLVSMTKRYSDVPLPAIEVVDMKDERHRKKNSGIFSSVLLSGIRKALAERTQVILFQNRRGYSPFLQCPDCGYIPKCTNCDVSLTVHMAFRALTCHYCGYTENLPSTCPKCGSSKINNMGFGTERIEDELSQIFPEAKIARMDLDTTRTRNAYVKIISSFETGAVDILIGTQMVSKGLDFKNVSLVGVLNADNLLNYPDFRANEKAFQMLTQVSGRAGRAGKQGRVILQTSTADSEVIRQVINNDYPSMFSTQMTERKMFKYPPFFRLIYVELRHRDQGVTNAAADFMATAMRKVFGWRVLGPDNPPVPRIQNKYIRRIVLKIEATSSNVQAKALLRSASEQMLAIDRFKSVIVSLDVDPV